MRRTIVALTAVAVATIATIGVVRVTADSEHAQRPSTSVDRHDDGSRDFDRQQFKDQAALQAKHVKEAQAELARAVKEYAKKHAHHSD